MMTKKEFLERFSDKQKIDIANEYLCIFYDSYLSDGNYLLRAMESESNTQKLEDSILNIATQRIK
jgi:hypothetical protein